MYTTVCWSNIYLIIKIEGFYKIVYIIYNACMHAIFFLIKFSVLSL
jgi:hypothetical protein